MNYSRGELSFLLKAIRAKAAWALPEKKIPRKRRQMERLGVMVLGKTSPGVQRIKREYQGYVYYDLIPEGVHPKHVIYYSHGGGYVYEISRFHWEFLMDICVRTQSRIVVPIYPLAPEHKKAEVFPWIANLFIRTCETASYPEGEAPAASNYLGNARQGDVPKIILMGDSAGGGISLALAMLARDEKIYPIDATVLISPWIDIKMRTPEMEKINKTDPLLDLDGLLACGRHYLGTAEDDYKSSPLQGDFSNLEKLSVVTGTNDILNPVARNFREKCQAQNIPLDYYEEEGGFHVFPVFRTPDGLRGRERIVEMVNNTSK